MNSCITPLRNVSVIREISGSNFENWLKRLNVVPLKVKIGTTEGITSLQLSHSTKIINYGKEEFHILWGHTHVTR